MCVMRRPAHLGARPRTLLALAMLLARGQTAYDAAMAKRGSPKRALLVRRVPQARPQHADVHRPSLSRHTIGLRRSG